MYFTNPFYASIDLYLKEVQSLLDKDYTFKLTYKSDEENIKDTVRFRLFDMESNVVNKDNLIVKEINYQGYLEFIYDKRTKLVLINHIPTFKYGKVVIPIFTSDLVSTIIKALNKFLPAEEIKINFKNPLEVITIDKKVEDLLPDIKMTKNYVLLNKIRENIRIEEAKIRGHIIREKEKQDRIWRSEERVMAKKSKVFGIKPEDYRTKEDFERALEQELIPMWEKKKTNIERHLKLNETAYKELMLKADPEFICLKRFIYEYVNYKELKRCGLTYYNQKPQNKYVSCAKDESLPPQISHLIDKYGTDIERMSKEDIDTFLDYFMNCDLSGEKNLVDLYENTCDKICDEYKDCCYNGYSDYDFEYAGYELDYHLYNLAFKDQNYWGEYEEYNHPIFHLDSMDKMFEKGINLLMQIHALRKKLEYYQNILNNPRKATNIYVKNSTVSGLIMDLPAWFRIERDTFSSIPRNEREFLNLLMIKPGTRQIDLDETRIFATQNGRTFGKTESAILRYLSQPRDYLLKCNRFIITIPNSLTFEEIKKIIDFSFLETTEVINIICESPTTAYLVKSIIWFKMKNIVSENCDEYDRYKRIFVNIDPNYYRNFWMTTPDNKKFYHLYDYTSDYKYHRKLKCSFTDYLLWPYAIASGVNTDDIYGDASYSFGDLTPGVDWGDEYTITPDDFDNLNYEMIEELIFGSYGNPKYLEEAEKLDKLINEVTKGHPIYPYVYNKEKAIRERQLKR